MIHDQRLVDRLSVLPTELFDGAVFRATGADTDATAPSISGGRWAPPPRGDSGVSVLYTSLERDGAIAEVVSFLADLNPIPGPRPIKITRLAVTTAKTLRLARANLQALGVDLARYGERDYGRTQAIGAASEFLGLDGLLAPSARWPCDNLMIFTLNHGLNDRLEALSSEQIEWRGWARAHGILASDTLQSAAANAEVIRLKPRQHLP
jgi:RES domain